MQEFSEKNFIAHAKIVNAKYEADLAAKRIKVRKMIGELPDDTDREPNQTRDILPDPAVQGELGTLPKQILLQLHKIRDKQGSLAPVSPLRAAGIIPGNRRRHP